jgi:hypothetical protein
MGWHVCVLASLSKTSTPQEHIEKSPSKIAKSPLYLFGELTGWATARAGKPSLSPKLAPALAPDGWLNSPYRLVAALEPALLHELDDFPVTGEARLGRRDDEGN